MSKETTFIDELNRLGNPLTSQVTAMGHAEMLRLFDASAVPGRHYAMATRFLSGYTPAVISALVEAGSNRTSELSGISIHHFHGAAARVCADATAFNMRRYHLMVEILAAWEPEDADPARHRAWAQAVSSDLAHDALPGGYPNLLGPDDREQIADAYGANAPRLQIAKAHLDPQGIFSAVPIPTSS